MSSLKLAYNMYIIALLAQQQAEQTSQVFVVNEMFITVWGWMKFKFSQWDQADCLIPDGNRRYQVFSAHGLTNEGKQTVEYRNKITCSQPF